jgi:hypothetical protein
MSTSTICGSVSQEPAATARRVASRKSIPQLSPRAGAIGSGAAFSSFTSPSSEETTTAPSGAIAMSLPPATVPRSSGSSHAVGSAPSTVKRQTWSVPSPPCASAIS